MGFLGQNGAGKTTLMRILTSYLTPTSGDVYYDDLNIQNNSLEARRRLGYLPEMPPLYHEMSVKSYLKFSAELKNVPVREITASVDRALSDCRLNNVCNKRIGVLSKGYKQRVGLAQAIINDPDILILDEPMSGLDPVQILQVRTLIKNLEHKRTVILSTHILSEIERIVQRVMFIKAGSVIKDTSIDSLAETENRTFVVKVKSDEQFLQNVLKDITCATLLDVKTIRDCCEVSLSVPRSEENVNTIAAVLTEKRVSILEIIESRPSLEQKFIEVISEEDHA